MDISIVLTFYNAENEVIPLLSGLSTIFDKKYIDYEIIAVNNNSIDNTGEVIKQFCNQHSKIKYLFVKEQGYGNAVRNGLAIARGKWIGWSDGDLQIKPLDIFRVVKHTLETNAIFCKAERRIRYDGIVRFILTHLYRIVISMFLRKRVFDVNAKPKFIRRLLYSKFHLKSGGWFIDLEFISQVLQFGLGGSRQYIYPFHDVMKFK